MISVSDSHHCATASPDRDRFAPGCVQSGARVELLGDGKSSPAPPGPAGKTTRRPSAHHGKIDVDTIGDASGIRRCFSVSMIRVATDLYPELVRGITMRRFGQITTSTGDGIEPLQLLPLSSRPNSLFFSKNLATEDSVALQKRD